MGASALHSAWRRGGPAAPAIRRPGAGPAPAPASRPPRASPRRAGRPPPRCAARRGRCPASGPTPRTAWPTPFRSIPPRRPAPSAARPGRSPTPRSAPAKWRRTPSTRPSSRSPSRPRRAAARDRPSRRPRPARRAWNRLIFTSRQLVRGGAITPSVKNSNSAPGAANPPRGAWDCRCRPAALAASWQWRRIVSSSIRRPAISSSRSEAMSNDQLAASRQVSRVAPGLRKPPSPARSSSG